jgi:hypothetical protein
MSADFLSPHPKAKDTSRPSSDLLEMSEAKFLVPDWGRSSTKAWRAGTTTLRHSRLYPPVRD